MQTPKSKHVRKGDIAIKVYVQHSCRGGTNIFNYVAVAEDFSKKNDAEGVVFFVG